MNLHFFRAPLTDVRHLCRKLTDVPSGFVTPRGAAGRCRRAMMRVGVVAGLVVSAPRDAEAACTLRQTPTKDGARIELAASSEPLTCRTMSFSSSGAPLSARAWIRDSDGRRHRLAKDHVVQRPEGLQVGAPELEVGDTLEIALEVPGSDLTVTVGDFASEAAAQETHVTRTVLLDERHPGWGFADPVKGRTRTERKTLGPDGSRTVELPGALAQDIVRISPGSFTLILPASDVTFSMGPGVTQSVVAGGWRFDAPNGGELRYCVRRVMGDTVVTDERTFIAGTEWHFRQVSLPEPATPVELHGRTDLPQVRAELYDAVRALRIAALPAREALRPRPLNRAWRSTWATAVERGLILQRLLWQEKIGAEWVLTGAQPDLLTLTGLDVVLLRTTLGGEELWLDPSCDSCAPGEISTRWMGRPSVGAARTVPRQPGTLTRTLSLVGDEFHATFVATGAAALWLREAAGDATVDGRMAAMATALGMPGATVSALEGSGDAGQPIRISLEGPTARDPMPPAETPWDGGWTDG